MQRKAREKPESVELTLGRQAIQLDLREDEFTPFVKTGIMPVGSEKNKSRNQKQLHMSVNCHVYKMVV